MFYHIPEKTLQRMHALETQYANEQHDDPLRLFQISPETGRFISIMASMAPEGNWLEIGTSGGYSALWISLAARLKNQKLTTFELDPAKITLAQTTFSQTETAPFINLVEGDVLAHLADYQEIAFCFLDAEKRIYRPCYDIMVPNMVAGAVLVADNILSHQRLLQPFINQVMQDPRMDAVIVPIGKGILLARKIGD